jgi:hypothetical protein
MMAEPEKQSWLGRGWLDVPGKPFGWAWHMERDEIRRHLRRRVWKFGLDGLAAFRLEERVTAIQRHLHRSRPTMAQRQQAWRERCAAQAPPPTGTTMDLTWEELAHLADLFSGANDPLSVTIGQKAATALARREA